MSGVLHRAVDAAHIRESSGLQECLPLYHTYAEEDTYRHDDQRAMGISQKSPAEGGSQLAAR
eukprot:5944840-Pyramimonas_sp.AAC.2